VIRDTEERNSSVGAVIESAHNMADLSHGKILAGLIYDNAHSGVNVTKALKRACELNKSNNPEELISYTLSKPNRGYYSATGFMTPNQFVELSETLLTFYPAYAANIVTKTLQNIQPGAQGDEAGARFLDVVVSYPNNRLEEVAAWILAGTDSVERRKVFVESLLKKSADRSSILRGLIDGDLSFVKDSAKQVLSHAQSRDEVFNLVEIAVKADPTRAYDILDETLPEVQKVPGYTDDLPDTLKRYVRMLIRNKN
jgi:hypothetical protein